MSRARYGDRRACVTCGADIEFVGRKAGGWWDRGGSFTCAGSGAVRHDGDGCPVPFHPTKKHQPYKGEA